MSLALQGGGAHGAFTWGVLDRLLEDERLVIDGISGTRAGAMNGAMLAYGMAIGGRVGAREMIRAFWRRIAECTSYGIFRPMLLDRLLGHHNLDHSPFYWAFDAVTRVLSPYQLNPTGVNPLGDILSELIDFDRLRAAANVKLFACATNVCTGKIRVFQPHEISADALLASACLPTAVTDKKTVLSMTNHAYFNLAAHNAGQAALLNHQVKINAQSFVELSYGFAPTGNLASVASVPAYDFRTFKTIRAGLADEATCPQQQYAFGFDNCFVLDRYDGRSVRKAVTVFEPTTGRQMDVYTDQPGIQFYTGNGLAPALYPGKAGAAYDYRSGMALETEHFPDSPNHPNFPTTVLNPGQDYRTTTIYKFSVR